MNCPAASSGVSSKISNTVRDEEYDPHKPWIDMDNYVIETIVKEESKLIL